MNCDHYYSLSILCFITKEHKTVPDYRMKIHFPEDTNELHAYSRVFKYLSNYQNFRHFINVFQYLQP